MTTAGAQRYDLLKGMANMIDMANNSMIKKLLGGGQIDDEIDVITSQIGMIKQLCDAHKEEWKNI